MGQTLVITLREGIEAALVVGIILAYLAKVGRAELARQVYWGVALAVAASVVVAALFQALGLDPENEYLEGALMLTAGVMVATLVVWMWRAARNIRGEVEQRLSGLVLAESGRGQRIGLLLFTFLMVFREGVETVLFFIAATLEGATLLDVVGALVGLGLAVLFAFFFVKGSLRIHLPRFFAVTGAVLVVLSLKLILGGLHEFAEVGLIPLTKEVMAIIGYFVRDESSAAVLMGLLFIPVVLVLWEARSASFPIVQGEESPVERRKRMAAQRQERLWRFGLVGVAVMVLWPLTSAALAGSGLYDPAPQPVSPVEDRVVLDVGTLEPQVLHKFEHEVHGVGVRFLVFVHEDGSVSTALDTCQICGPVGYAQDRSDKNVAICKNCQAPIPMDTIGQGGGCNPLPLNATFSGDKLLIPVSELAKAVPEFQK